MTDDFSMGAVTLSREGAAGGAIAALNAGVDLILVSYDPDQYFPVMYALLAADRDGRFAPMRSKRAPRGCDGPRIARPCNCGVFAAQDDRLALP